MANDNKNFNNLVSPPDEDPTTEFEVSDEIEDAFLRVLPTTEGNEKTFDVDKFTGADDSEFDSDSVLTARLRQQSETIEQLQFDLEQIRGKATGLDREVRAREEITANINIEFRAVKQQLAEAKRDLQDRQHEISFLQHALKESGDATSKATTVAERVREEFTQEVDYYRGQVAEQSGLITSNAQELRQLAEQVLRTEKYADSLRIKLQAQQYSSKKTSDSYNSLEQALKSARTALEEVRDQLAAEQSRNVHLTIHIENMQEDFDRELRQVRFELGEAQETISCKDSMNEQLASDLIDNRGFRQALESQLGEFEKESQLETQKLTRRLRSAQEEADEFERKMKAKDKAIAALMNELANLSRTETAREAPDVAFRKVDGHRSSTKEDGQARNRVARLLIGESDGRQLRFPLFKDRLTIGRTSNNDIQLSVRYISRRHAVIVTDNGQTRLVDWGSKNGVYVNQKRIAEKFLKSGDTVTIGTTTFRYEERPKR